MKGALAAVLFGGELRLAHVGGDGDEALTDHDGFAEEKFRYFWFEYLGQGEIPEAQPALEVPRVHLWNRQVGHHGVAFVAPGGEHDGTPEILELGQMFRPIGDDAIENRPNQVILADASVKSIDEGGDACFVQWLGHGLDDNEEHG